MSQWLAGIIIGAIGGGVTYIAAIRRASGRVETTEASELWSEARTMREDYRKQLETALELIERLRTRISELESDNYELRVEVRDLLKRVHSIENGEAGQ